ncbi:MAG TPA: RHS repeat-associated core domain-containing protein, partial [Vicinamibacteria bacterium]
TSTLWRADYTHDAMGNITTWQQRDGGATPNSFVFGYDAADQLTSADFGGGAPPLASVQKRYRYAYDAAGNRTEAQVDGTPNGASYDETNRILGDQPWGGLQVAGFTDEAAAVAVQGMPAAPGPGNQFSGPAAVGPGGGNFTVTARDGSGNVRTNDYKVTVPPGGVSRSYTHDANGNLVRKVEGSDVWVYEWYADDRLAAVTKNGMEQARFIYDGLGRRRSKAAQGVTTTYTYDGEDILRETLSSGATYWYVHGPGIDEPLARRGSDASTIFYHVDHLGSIVKTTDAGGGGVTTRAYDPFGKPLAGAAEAGYAFTGREWDPETGLYYYRARYYDPKTGRFISEDPIGFAGADVNVYAYVWNQPARFIDPMGTTGLEPVAGTAGYQVAQGVLAGEALTTGGAATTSAAGGATMAGTSAAAATGAVAVAAVAGIAVGTGIDQFVVKPIQLQCVAAEESRKTRCWKDYMARVRDCRKDYPDDPVAQGLCLVLARKLWELCQD